MDFNVAQFCHEREIDDRPCHGLRQGLVSSIFSVTTNKQRFKCKTKNL